MKKNIFFIVLLFTFVKSNAQNFTKTIDPKTGFLTVKNKICGVVIPWQNAVTKKQFSLAPLQSFIYKDGTWCDTSINVLTSVVKPYYFKPSIVKETTEQITYLLQYKFKKQQYYFGSQTYKGGEPGEGFYNVTITIWNNKKSITIEEETNYDVEFEFSVNNGLQANTGRYRGFMANTKEDGYEPNGEVYRREYERGYTLDAQVDFDFKKEKLYYYFIPWSGPGVEINTGRYWQLFNNSASTNANVFGTFQGRANRLVAATAMGPRMKTYTNQKGQHQIDFLIQNYRRGPDNSFTTYKRIEWNVFIGTKVDVKPANQQQEIGNELNYFAGLKQKIDRYANEPLQLVPSFYDGAIYMSKEQMQLLIKKVKTDEIFYNYIKSFDDGLTNPIWETWRDITKAKKLIEELIAYKKDLINEYKNGDGPYAIMLRNSYGVRFFRVKAFIISSLFADKSIAISKEDKKELEQLVGMLARIIWDNDNVPVNENLGIATGTANIMHQYTQAGRYFFALLLANDKEFKSRAKEAYTQVAKEAQEVIYPNGSTFGNPHYIGATFEPFLLLLLQLKQIGYKNIFLENRVKDFADFYATLFTPKSIRFAGNRKLINYGDGTEESSLIAGLLGQGFYGVNEKLSLSWYGLFKNGPIRGGTHAPAPLLFDLQQQKQEPLLATSSSYEGYLSHCRVAVNTNKESALWCINGNKYFDHRCDDASELIIHALGAPLVVSRNAMYAPRADAAHIRAMVVPQKLFPNWDGDNQPIDKQPFTWPKSNLINFATCSKFTTFTIENINNDLKWYRTVTTITTTDSTPIFIITDSVNNNDGAVFSLPMLALNNITTSNGNLKATPKNFIYNQSSKELPSGTKAITFNNNWNTFNVEGQIWKTHPTNGIDWDIFTYSKNPIKISTANWTTTYASNVEQNEFEKTNGTPYKETLQLFRACFNKKISTFILPRNKGANAFVKLETKNYNQIVLVNNIDTVTISEDFFTLKNKNEKTIGVLSKLANIGNYTIEGGNTQLTETKTELTIEASGNKGSRKVQLPFVVASSNNSQVKTNLQTKTTSILVNVTNDGKNTANGSSNNVIMQLVK